jgi:cytochrome c peroxidase
VDVGLAANPLVDDPVQVGKFRVPTLRNVAVTAPYMHNGVFADLNTAVFFYGKYILENRPSRINPETGHLWREAEVEATVDLELLSGGQPLDSQRSAYLVAFLKTLTDRRYEHLLR